jgi:hypothetical protein
MNTAHGLEEKGFTVLIIDTETRVLFTAPRYQLSRMALVQPSTDPNHALRL